MSSNIDSRLLKSAMAAILAAGFGYLPASADIVQAPADSIGILASRQSTIPLADPVIERAVEALRKLEKNGSVQPVDKKQVPDNIVKRSHRKNLDRVLILGGPEAFPM